MGQQRPARRRHCPSGGATLHAPRRITNGGKNAGIISVSARILPNRIITLLTRQHLFIFGGSQHYSPTISSVPDQSRTPRFLQSAFRSSFFAGERYHHTPTLRGVYRPVVRSGVSFEGAFYVEDVIKSRPPGSCALAFAANPIDGTKLTAAVELWR